MSFPINPPCRAIALAIFAFTQATPVSAATPTAVPAQDPHSQTPSLPMGGPEFRKQMLAWSIEMAPTASVVREISPPSLKRPLISSPFGWRRDPIKGSTRRHEGVDLPARQGTRIYATGAGIVTLAGWVNGYGNLVQIDHPGGVRTRYGHLSRILTSRGTSVEQGDLVGQMGSTGRSTGSHLHYEVRINGTSVDPLAYMGQETPSYNAVWLPEARVSPRWSGWANVEGSNSLPQATIPR